MVDMKIIKEHEKMRQQRNRSTSRWDDRKVLNKISLPWHRGWQMAARPFLYY